MHLMLNLLQFFVVLLSKGDCLQTREAKKHSTFEDFRPGKRIQESVILKLQGESKNVVGVRFLIFGSSVFSVPSIHGCKI